MKSLGLILLLLFSPIASRAEGFTPSGVREVTTAVPRTRALDLRFIQATGAPSVLAAPTVVDAYTITVVSATGFVDGTYILIAETGDRFYLATQQGAPAGNVITLDTPLDKTYPAGTLVLPTTYAMNVDGSVTPQVFQIGSSGSDTHIDITRFVGYLQDGSIMDDSKFGSLPALTNGCVLRVTNGESTNMWTIKTNSDWAGLGFDFKYPEKPPSGKYSARFRITYGGITKHGVVIPVPPGSNVALIVQDDLTGLEVFNMWGHGNVAKNP